MLLYINKMITFVKFIFYISLSLLIIISLYPGSLIGYLLYGNLGQQPDLISNPFGTSINHFISYLYVSILGLFIYLNNHKIVYWLFLLAIILELLHFVIPNRSLQPSDLIANILGVVVAYSIIKIYLLLNKQ